MLGRDPHVEHNRFTIVDFPHDGPHGGVVTARASRPGMSGAPQGERSHTVRGQNGMLFPDRLERAGQGRNAAAPIGTVAAEEIAGQCRALVEGLLGESQSCAEVGIGVAFDSDDRMRGLR